MAPMLGVVDSGRLLWLVVLAAVFAILCSIEMMLYRRENVKCEKCP